MKFNKNAFGGTEMQIRHLIKEFGEDNLDKFNIIPSRLSNYSLSSKKPNILWVHDLPNDPMYDSLEYQETLNKIDKFVFVSNWQMQMFNLIRGVPYNKSVVIENGIEPIQFEEKKWDGTVNLIYHTTPHRGLEILYPIFDILQENFTNVHLDVYSSFDAYGNPQRDQEYQKLFDMLEDHPKITYHGYQKNSVIREALVKAHIFAYPCVYTETSCIAAIEAASACCDVVAPNLGALPETLGNMYKPYQWSENRREHSIKFGNALARSVAGMANDQFRENLRNSLILNKVSHDLKYSFPVNIKKQWEALFTELAQNKKGG